MKNAAAPIEAECETVLRKLESFESSLGGTFLDEAGSTVVQAVLNDVIEAWNDLPPVTKAAAPAWDFTGRYLHVTMGLAKRTDSPANRSDARELVTYILWALTPREI